MFQHDIRFFANLMTFFSKQKKVIKCLIFIYIFHTRAKFQTKKNKMVMTCVFEIFQSHCHILKELNEF
jgi:hypothetical protein